MLSLMWGAIPLLGRDRVDVAVDGIGRKRRQPTNDDRSAGRLRVSSSVGIAAANIVSICSLIVISLRG